MITIANHLSLPLLPTFFASSPAIQHRHPQISTKSFFKPLPRKIKPLSLSIKSSCLLLESPSKSLLPLLKSNKPKPPMIIPSPIPILRTSLITGVTNVTIFFATIESSSLSDQMESAKSMFVEIIKESTPLLLDAYLSLQDSESYYELEDVKEMIEEAINSEARKPSADTEIFIGFMLMYAFYHEMNGNYMESLRIYDELLSKYPQNHRVYLCKGVLHTTLNEKEGGDECFDKYMNLVPKDDPHKEILDDYLIKTRAYVEQF